MSIVIRSDDCERTTYKFNRTCSHYIVHRCGMDLILCSVLSATVEILLTEPTHVTFGHTNAHISTHVQTQQTTLQVYTHYCCKQTQSLAVVYNVSMSALIIMLLFKFPKNCRPEYFSISATLQWNTCRGCSSVIGLFGILYDFQRVRRNELSIADSS